MNTLLNCNPNIREPGGELLMRSSGAGAHYYHYDELGSTRLLTNSTGAVTDTYTYDAYGSLLTHNRSTGSVDQPYQYVGRLGYYTHHQSPDFRWLQLGVRFYQPDEGRFERRDQLEEGESHYPYAVGSPLLRVDPSGLKTSIVGRNLCLCVFSGRRGKLVIDSSCSGRGGVWVYPEDSTLPAYDAPATGTTLSVDGVIIDGETYKIPGSTCVDMICRGRDVELRWCANCLGLLIGGAGAPSRERWGYFGKHRLPPNRPPRRIP